VIKVPTFVSVRWDTYWRKALQLVEGGSEAEALRARRLILQREAEVRMRHSRRIIDAARTER
jgi:hypothetical protein